MLANQATESLKAKPPNPVYERLTHGARPPTVKQTAVLTTILMAISIALMIFTNETVWGFLFPVALGALLLLAPIIAGIAALITANDAQGEGFALQKITTLPHEVVVRGYSRAALFRARLLIALAIGLLPLVAWLTQTTIRPRDCHVFLPGSEYHYVVPPYPETRCAPPGDVRFILLPVSQFAALGAVELAALPAVLFGVWIGLALRRPALAATIAVLVTGCLILAYLVVLMPATDSSFRCQISCIVYHPWPNLPMVAGFFVTVLALATFGMERLARRAV